MNDASRGGLKARPSLFDIGLYLFSFLCPIFFFGNWDLNMIQGIFFAFGTFALLGLSFLCKKEREYSNKFIGAIVLWSLINVFIHSFKFSLSNGQAASFINYCLMSEGFIFILCGSLLFYLVVSYKRNFNIAYPILMISILNLVFIIFQRMGIPLIWTRISGICGILGMASHMVIFSAISIPILFHFYKPLSIIPVINMFIGHYGWSNSFTGLFALFVSVSVYLVVKRNFIKLSFWLISGLTFIGINYVHFFRKFGIRMSLWVQSIKDIGLHPFIGSGFDNSLSMNMIDAGNGLMYRHNDYLNIARDLGIPFLILILIVVWGVLRKSEMDYLSVSILIVMVGCMTWTSMYFARIGSIGIVLLGLKEAKK